MLMDASKGLSILGSAAVLVAVVAPTVLKIIPVETPKGKDSTVAIVSQAAEAGALERVEAKLWEDPFEAIGAAERERRKEVRELKEIGEHCDVPRLAPSDVTVDTARACQRDGYHISADRLAAEFKSALERDKIRKTQISTRIDCDFVAEQANRTMDRRVHKPKCDLNAPSAAIVQLILIPVHSGRSFDAVESRRQARVALQTAMLSRDWAAQQESLIGSLRWSPDHVPPDDIPFEVFQHASGALAVVLWLDEERFPNTREMRALVADLTGASADASEICDAGAPCSHGYSVSIIGPTGTGGLISMLKQAEDPHDKTRASTLALPRLWAHLFSPVSSVDEADIFDTPNLRWQLKPLDDKVSCMPQPEARIHCEFAKLGLIYTRAVTKDEKVMGVILKEIQRRREAVQPRECTVLLVSEGDSLYARALTARIEQQLQGTGPANGGDCQLLQVPGREAAGAYQFLQSINDPRASGALDERDQTRASRNSGSAYGDKLITGSRDAISEGNQQFDYIRRLTRRIEDDAGADRLDTERVFAVGVFGTDPHDKVSILKLLKPALPHARFFTTDLDAVLYDADHVTWTRNLIVGSATGLEAGGSARGMPPFRRMRQTSYVEAISAALGGDGAVRAEEAPHLYEIGLAGPIRLGVPLGVCSVSGSIGARWASISWTYKVGAILLVALLVAGCVRFGAHRLWRLVVDYVDGDAWNRSTMECRTERAGVAIRATLSGMAILATALWWVVAVMALAESCSGNGEPLVLFQGASLWAPTFVRALAITLGIVALITFLGCSRKTTRSVGNHRGLFERANKLTAAAPSPMIPDYLGFPRKSGTLDRPRLWLAYTRHTCFSGVAAVVVGVVLFLLYLGLLAFVHDPNIPSRGPVMTFLSQLSIWLSGTIAFTLAAASWLQTKAMRSFVHQAIPAEADPCEAPPLAEERTSKGDGPVGDDQLLHAPGHLNQKLEEWGLLPLPTPDGSTATAQGAPGRTALQDARTRRRIDDVLILELIERLARPAQVFVYMPLVMASLLILARWRLFENQTFPPALWISFAALITLSLWNAWRLSTLASRTHARMRREIADDLRAAQRRLGTSEGDDEGARIKAEISLLSALDERLKLLNSGIFAPLLAQPFFKALLIPLGTGSVLEWVAVAKGFG